MNDKSFSVPGSIIQAILKKKGSWLPLALISAIVFPTMLTYSRSFSIPLISDDYIATTDLSSWWGVRSIYFFRPICQLYFNILRPLFGYHPAGYHLMNLLFHIANALMVFVICFHFWKMGEKEDAGGQHHDIGLLASAALALAFALSYSHCEAVFWIVGITSLLEGFFILLVIYLYLLYLDKRRPLYLWSACLIFILGLGAKEGVILIIGILPLLYWIRENRLRLGKATLAWIPFWAVGIFYLLSIKQISVMTSASVYSFRIGFSLFRNIQQFALSAIYWTPFRDISISTAQLRLLHGSNLPRINLDVWLILAVIGYAIFLLLLITGGMRTRLGFLMFLGVMLPFSLPVLSLCGWYRYPYPFRTYYLPVIFFTFMIILYMGRVRTKNHLKAVRIFAALLLAISLAGGIRVWNRSGDWLLVGRKYTFIREKLARRVRNVRTPNVQFRIHDPESDEGRHYNRGIFTLFENGLFPVLAPKGINRENIYEVRLLTKENATALSEEEKNLIRTGKLTVILYADNTTRILVP